MFLLNDFFTPYIIYVCLLILYNRTYYDSVQEDGPDVVKEGLVVEGVCGLQDDGGQQEVEEELGSELEEEVVEVAILDNRRPQHTHNNQQTAGLLTMNEFIRWQMIHFTDHDSGNLVDRAVKWWKAILTTPDMMMNSMKITNGPISSHLQKYSQ